MAALSEQPAAADPPAAANGSHEGAMGVVAPPGAEEEKTTAAKIAESVDAPPRLQTAIAAAPNVPATTAAVATHPPRLSESGSAGEGNGSSEHEHDANTNPVDFEGSVDSNNELPSAETIARIEKYVVLDRDGKSHPFKSLYTGKHVARPVLLIFVRHFFCGVRFHPLPLLCFYSC